MPDVRSDFEAIVLPRLVRMGLPRPETNVRMLIEGEVLEVDFLWEGKRLVVETDGGGTHETPVAFQRDRHRDQLLVASGYRVMRATWDQIHGDLEGVVGRISLFLKGSLPICGFPLAIPQKKRNHATEHRPEMSVPWCSCRHWGDKGTTRLVAWCRCCGLVLVGAA